MADNPLKSLDKHNIWHTTDLRQGWNKNLSKLSGLDWNQLVRLEVIKLRAKRLCMPRQRRSARKFCIYIINCRVVSTLEVPSSEVVLFATVTQWKFSPSPELTGTVFRSRVSRIPHKINIQLLLWKNKEIPIALCTYLDVVILYPKKHKYNMYII